MTQVHLHHGKEPIRLFQSDVLEFFTHTHPIVVPLLWGPVVVFFAVEALRHRAAGHWVYLPLLFLGGLFLWTLAEYMAHRFLFHFRARTPRQERFSFLIHGVHHAQPLSKTRLVLPPAISIPAALIFYGLYYVLVGVILGFRAGVAPLFASFVLGYILYDLGHYTMHHINLRGGYLKYMRQYHMRHHHTPDRRFGVSSPLWDYVWGTRPS